MEFLPFDFLFLNVFTISNFSKILMCGIDSKLLIPEYSFKSLVISVSLEITNDIAVVLFSYEEFKFSCLLGIFRIYE